MSFALLIFPVMVTVAVAHSTLSHNEQRLGGPDQRPLFTKACLFGLAAGIVAVFIVMIFA